MYCYRYMYFKINLYYIYIQIPDEQFVWNYIFEIMPCVQMLHYTCVDIAKMLKIFHAFKCYPRSTALIVFVYTLEFYVLSISFLAYLTENIYKWLCIE